MELSPCTLTYCLTDVENYCSSTRIFCNVYSLVIFWRSVGLPNPKKKRIEIIETFSSKLNTILFWYIGLVLLLLYQVDTMREY